MKLVENEIFHVYNRGNQQQPIFFNKENYLFFLQKVRSHLCPICDILAYCLMPNHFHFLIRTNAKTVAPAAIPNRAIRMNAFSKEMGKLLSSYTRALQKQEGFTGSLFQQKTKAKQVSGRMINGADYTITCLRYILHNPVAAKLVTHPVDWAFSNAAGIRGMMEDPICSIEVLMRILNTHGMQPDDLIKHPTLNEPEIIF
jgi:putative transposase